MWLFPPMENIFYPNTEKQNHLPADSLQNMSDFECLKEIKLLKNELQHKLALLGHHYQNDDIISFADFTGDSLKLSQQSANLNKEHIVFCGVHFMAETTDILCQPEQKVYLPDLNAGCTMADMAQIDQVESAWKIINQVLENKQKVIPITYINCTADLKAFVGRNDGCICTSSNAEKIISWAFEQGQKLFFFPDQHLGRNTCFDLGIPLDQMVVYNPNKTNGGLTEEQIRDAKVFLWAGHCSVHQGFKIEQIDYFRKHEPETKIIVHPECSFDVFNNADDAGSTAYIINTIQNAPAGSSFAVGTENNLVNRLADSFPHLTVKSLSPFQCLCTTMYRIRPKWLLKTLQDIKIGNNQSPNIIKVDEGVKELALLAINRMLELS
ncbi:quinolinate synthase NadA [Bacteriovoracaceae bacterium]|nr:quinolinate synthase NadA [Bacteriovoracaceae bacterium]